MTAVGQGPEHAVGPDGPVYLTTEELAERFRMRPDAIRQWRHRGGGPLGVRIGKRVLYPLPEVQSWERKQLEAARRQHRQNSGVVTVIETSAQPAHPVRAGRRTSGGRS